MYFSKWWSDMHVTTYTMNEFAIYIKNKLILPNNTITALYCNIK